VQIVTADPRHTGLPRGSFDLVHARTLLINITDPTEVVAEMVRLTRPRRLGGVDGIRHGARATQPSEPTSPTQHGHYLGAALPDLGTQTSLTAGGRDVPGGVRRAVLGGLVERADWRPGQGRNW